MTKHSWPGVAVLAAASIALIASSLPAQAAPPPGVLSHVDADSALRVGPTADADPTTKLTLFAGLPRNSERLATRARAVSTPGSKAFRSFATLAAVGRQYGASAKAIDALKSTAGKLGLTVEIDPTGLFARLTATVATWEKVLGTKVTYTPAPKASAGGESGPYPYATYYFVDASSGNFIATPSNLASVVREFIPAATIYDAAQDIPGPAPLMVRPKILVPNDDTPLPWPANEGSPLGAACDQPAVQQRQLYTPQQTRDVYGTSTVLQKGGNGATARVTIVSLGGGFSDEDLGDYAKCFGVTKPTINVRLGTGVPTEIVSDSGETHLDLQTVTGALANAKRIDLQQEVNDSFSIGILDGFARALDYNGKATQSPDAVSLSYGVCEIDNLLVVQDGVLGSPVVPLIEDVLTMAGLVGTSVFASSGDYGSSVCQMGGEPERAIGTIEYPAASPWLTAVGGTRLRLGEGNIRVDEVAWNDLPYGLPAAGTGGYSVTFGAPWYQPATFPRDRRTVPDVALLAAVRPGWALVYGGELTSIGGTSGSSPFSAANIALLSARERSKGRPGIGFANPWLYARPSGMYFDVDEGDNQIPVTVPGEFTNIPGCCQAVVGFDMVTGLGVPRFERLMAALDR